MDVAPRRILIFIPIAWWGGSQRYVFDVAQAACDAGHEVLVVTGEGELPKKLAEAGIAVTSASHFTRGVTPLSELSAFLDLIRTLQHFRPDVLHTNNSKGGIVGALAGRICGVPRIIFTAHGWTFSEAAWKKYPFWLAHYATVLLSSRTVCVSAAVYQYALRMPFARSKLQVIHNGVAPDVLLSRQDARAILAPHISFPFWIGTIAELHPNKQLDVLICAFEKIADQHPEATLVILGEGEERIMLEALVRTLGLEARVRLRGHVDHASRFLNALDLFVLPSRNEALGYALLEAGMANLPALASNVGGMPEIVIDGETGSLFPSGDADALALLLDRYLGDANLRTRMGSALNAHVREHFSKEQMLEKTLALY